MPNRPNFLPFFLVFFFLSVVLILIGTSGIFTDITSIFNKAIEPGKGITYFLTLRGLQDKQLNQLTQDNLNMKTQLQNEKNISNENNALKSQFEVSQNKSQKLLPAKVIGSPGFVPGVSLPEYLVINKGQNSGVKVGVPVLSNNFLVGKVVEVYPDISKVELITNGGSTIIAKVTGGGVTTGIVKGQGQDEMILDNVLLTSTLKKDADVVTKGEVNEKGQGYPPDISIGKISSVEKNQSDLFQRASIKSPVDFKNLELVFVMQ
jgi:rod shape-determining protein MreC